MRIIYNGIDLMAIETHEFMATPVYDDTGTDYLYTRYSMHVTAMVNGQLEIDNVVSGIGPLSDGSMSYRFGGVDPSEGNPSGIRSIGDLLGGAAGTSVRTLSRFAPRGVDLSYPADRGVAVPGPGTIRPVFIRASTVPTTHETVRHRLTTPQGKLYVFSGPGMETGTPTAGTSAPPPARAGAEVILEVPKGGRVDCKNGPTPRLLNVTMAVGDCETMTVDWMCEAYVNEAVLNYVQPSRALVSNRFHQTETVDDHGFTSLTTEGTALFRTDLLYTGPDNSANPDALRGVIFMPIPQGFVRKVDYVQGIPDGTGIRYGYTDRQVPVNFVAGPYCRAAEITVVHRQAIVSDMDILGGITGMVNQVTSTLLNFKWMRDGSGSAPGGRGKRPPIPAPRPLPAKLRGPGTGK